METSLLNPTASILPNSAASPVKNSAVLSSDFETFLKMLTAQAKFQDPLEPIDSSEYAAQLAQFSMVEQQVLSNDLLAALTAQLGSGNMAQMAGWIGMEARTNAPVQFDGSPITVDTNPAATSDEVHLVVYDSLGAFVQRVPLPVAAGPVQWAGVNGNGDLFPNGRYSFEVESRANGQVILTEKTETYSRITEARLEGTEILLILEGGSMIPTTAVTGLRAPS